MSLRKIYKVVVCAFVPIPLNEKKNCYFFLETIKLLFKCGKKGVLERNMGPVLVPLLRGFSRCSGQPVFCSNFSISASAYLVYLVTVWIQIISASTFFELRFFFFFWFSRNSWLCQLWTVHSCTVYGPTNYTFQPLFYLKWVSQYYLHI